MDVANEQLFFFESFYSLWKNNCFQGESEFSGVPQGTAVSRAEGLLHSLKGLLSSDLFWESAATERKGNSSSLDNKGFMQHLNFDKL